ncbi:hypothetical protein CROQUDRAFT_131588 [Cronartium quercuum f. sp. fusiforme G11]|uniref:Uncharacterized protein n=1 Tax=Cronartium quercuum f. sp. fusiforme G11 TaxID=708437 RepID=A0A9P6TE34_9BASI|nr:hypothetical protein CROQUDRAFT_131588 [Cronartium quercuum f. sp. fusiforme G11]
MYTYIHGPKRLFDILLITNNLKVRAQINSLYIFQRYRPTRFHYCNKKGFGKVHSTDVNERMIRRKSQTNAEIDSQEFSIGVNMTKKVSQESRTRLTSFFLDDKLVDLSAGCVSTLKMPLTRIDRNHATNIATFVFRIWVWGLGLWALLLKSVPHLVAMCLSQTVITVSSATDVQGAKTKPDFFDGVVINNYDNIDVISAY